ncbi:MAG: hypothetical protein DMG98_28795 [Acidobacteria bacterium]|nr:MAG: hypothetical protein DMG98_28795 [Acidobacteriota bacterium]
MPPRLLGFSTCRVHRHPRWLPPFSPLCRALTSGLWELALEELCAPSRDGGFTVNSSLSAVPVYLAFGFVPAGSIESKHGISFLPMRRPALLP